MSLCAFIAGAEDHCRDPISLPEDNLRLIIISMLGDCVDKILTLEVVLKYGFLQIS